MRARKHFILYQKLWSLTKLIENNEQSNQFGIGEEADMSTYSYSFLFVLF